MATDSLTLVIDEAGHLTVEGRAAQRRLAARPGRYRLIPSPANLVILERVAEEGAKAEPGHTVLCGDIERVGGLIDVIHFIFGSGWSGQLTVLDGAVRKTLYFKRGDVRMAASNVSEDRIGAILYRYGRISAQDLERALSQVTQEHRFGQVLVETGALTTHDLYQFVRKQVEEIFYSILVMRKGEYYFYRTGDDDVPPSQLQLSTKQLLFEGVRRIDEMSYFREKLPSPEVVLLRRDPPPSDKLPPRETRVLSLVDGVRDLGAIARESHLGEFETTKVCFQLMHAEWVLVRPETQSPSRPAAPQSAEAYRAIVDHFNEAYAKVHTAVAAQGKRDALFKGLDSFFQSAAEFAPLFVGVALDGEGRLMPDQLLSNLEMAPTDDRLDYLQRGMRELLFFELFSAGEAVNREDELKLHGRLQQILKEIPERGNQGAA